MNYFVLSLQSPADNLISNINSLLFQFIWGNKQDKISRSKICQNYSEGGLNVVDFSIHCTSLKVSVFQKLLRKSENTFASILSENYNITVNYFHMNGDYFIKLTSVRVKNPF